jgi:hypothetical protein
VEKKRVDFLFSSEGFDELKWIHEDYIEDRARREKKSFARAIEFQRMEAVMTRCEENNNINESNFTNPNSANPNSGNSNSGNPNAANSHSGNPNAANKRMTTASFLPDNPWGLLFGHCYSVVGVVSSRHVTGSNANGNAPMNENDGVVSNGNTIINISSGQNVGTHNVGTHNVGPRSVIAEHAESGEHGHDLENLHTKLEDKQIELELSRQKFLEEKLGIQRRYPPVVPDPSGKKCAFGGDKHKMLKFEKSILQRSMETQQQAKTRKYFSIGREGMEFIEKLNLPKTTLQELTIDCSKNLWYSSMMVV